MNLLLHTMCVAIVQIKGVEADALLLWLDGGEQDCEAGARDDR